DVAVRLSDGAVLYGASHTTGNPLRISRAASLVAASLCRFWRAVRISWCRRFTRRHKPICGPALADRSRSRFAYGAWLRFRVAVLDDRHMARQRPNNRWRVP